MTKVRKAVAAKWRSPVARFSPITFAKTSADFLPTPEIIVSIQTECDTGRGLIKFNMSIDAVTLSGRVCHVKLIADTLSIMRIKFPPYNVL